MASKSSTVLQSSSEQSSQRPRGCTQGFCYSQAAQSSFTMGPDNMHLTCNQILSPSEARVFGVAPCEQSSQPQSRRWKSSALRRDSGCEAHLCSEGGHPRADRWGNSRGWQNEIPELRCCQPEYNIRSLTDTYLCAMQTLGAVIQRYLKSLWNLFSQRESFNLTHKRRVAVSQVQKMWTRAPQRWKNMEE